ncbi:MAG: hypothetical protein RL722_2605, partial [Pseudomonadota bacterium]
AGQRQAQLCCRLSGPEGPRWIDWVLTTQVDAQGGLRQVHWVGRDVHEREELRRGLAAQSIELADLYDHAPCAYLDLGTDGLILRANSTALAWLGLGRDQVVGRQPIAEFLGDEGRLAYAREWPDFARTGVFLGFEADLRSSLGEQRRVRIEARGCRDAAQRFAGCHAVMYDVSEAHGLRLRLLALLHTQSAMLDNELVGIARIREGQLVWANRAVHRLLGHESGCLMGLPAAALYASPDDYARVHEQTVQALQAQGHCRLQVQLQHAAGHQIWVDLYGSLLEDHPTGAATPHRGESLWLMSDITELQERRLHSEHQARHDALTGLPNRRLLQDRLGVALARGSRSGELTALCVVDLDEFKPINDSHGHQAGDLVLKTVATRMLTCMRSNDTVARTGGDEFTVLIDGLRDPVEHLSALERMCGLIAEPIDLGGGLMVRVSASIGVALFPYDGSDAAEMEAQADAAMYLAKRRGRHCVAHAPASARLMAGSYDCCI